MNFKLTREQEKKRKAIEKRFRQCFKDLEDLAVEAGAVRERVELYFESEGHLNAMDGPSHGSMDGDYPSEHGGRSHQERIVCSIRWIGAANSIDCGAW